METVCHNRLIFESLFNKEVVADFTGGGITSDAGGLLLRELDQRYRLAEHAAQCLHDLRDSHRVKRDLLTLVRQRLFAIALGYEDNNDAATLAKDPAHKIMAARPRRVPRPWLPSPLCPGLRKRVSFLPPYEACWLEKYTAALGLGRRGEDLHSPLFCWRLTLRYPSEISKLTHNFSSEI